MRWRWFLLAGMRFEESQRSAGTSNWNVTLRIPLPFVRVVGLALVAGQPVDGDRAPVGLMLGREDGDRELAGPRRERGDVLVGRAALDPDRFHRLTARSPRTGVPGARRAARTGGVLPSSRPSAASTRAR